MNNHSKEYSSICLTPFTPFIILSPNDHKILYFTQSLARKIGFHPSIIASSISPLLQNPTLVIQNQESLDIYQIQQFHQSPPLSNDLFWIEELVHELRTASLTIDLGLFLIADNSHITPDVLPKLSRASRRQKISTLIVSDLLQLITTPPLIKAVSIIKILTTGLSHLPSSSHVSFYISSPMKTTLVDHINPIIWGNFHFLSNVFTTLLSWLKTEPVVLEMRTINPVVIQITLSIPDNHFLSNIQGFSLITHYLHKIAAYFNGCSWVTPTSINILFPLSLSSLT